MGISAKGQVTCDNLYALDMYTLETGVDRLAQGPMCDLENGKPERISREQLKWQSAPRHMRQSIRT